MELATYKKNAIGGEDMEMPWRMGLWFVLGAVVLNGCMADTWERYAAPQHGRDRAERICHPYTHCTQGMWVKDEPEQEDVAVVHARCTEEKLYRENGWSIETVSLGLEINRCMEDNGYRLIQE
ncbi:MAG: hypothetical protein NPIRA02_36120 [Nitrospirales bacterium]|nr:MAG: hypothetical protein NPIRA02_36120 [Nitrospirales bacterium]